MWLKYVILCLKYDAQLYTEAKLAQAQTGRQNRNHNFFLPEPNPKKSFRETIQWAQLKHGDSEYVAAGKIDQSCLLYVFLSFSCKTFTIRKPAKEGLETLPKKPREKRKPNL